jgi:MFS family permease
MFGGHLYTMINITSEHLAKYYGWTEETKTVRLVLLSTIIQVGSCIGCLIAPFFVVKGRRWSIMCYCVVVMVTSLLAYFEHEYILIVGRFVQGMFFGIHGSIFAVYNKEMSPPDMCG